MRATYHRIAPLILLALIAVISGTLSAQEKQLTIGFTNPTGTAALPYVMAEKKGFFKKEGLNAVVVIMQNQVVVNGVVSRSLDYGATIANFIVLQRAVCRSALLWPSWMAWTTCWSQTRASKEWKT